LKRTALEPAVLRSGQLRCFLLASDEGVLSAAAHRGWTPLRVHAFDDAHQPAAGTAASSGSGGGRRATALRAQLAPHMLPEFATFEYSAFIPFAAMASGAMLNIPIVFESISRFLSDGPSVGLATQEATYTATTATTTVAAQSQPTMPANSPSTSKGASASLVLRRHSAEARRVAEEWLAHEVRRASGGEAFGGKMPGREASGGEDEEEDSIAAASVARLMRREGIGLGRGVRSSRLPHVKQHGMSAAARTRIAPAVVAFSISNLYTASPTEWWRWWACRLRGPISVAYRETQVTKASDGGHGRCCRPGSAKS